MRGCVVLVVVSLVGTFGFPLVGRLWNGDLTALFPLLVLLVLVALLVLFLASRTAHWRTGGRSDFGRTSGHGGDGGGGE